MVDYRSQANAQLVPLNDAWQVRNITVGTSSIRLDLPPLDQRRAILIQVIGSGTAFIGPGAKVSAVGADRGHPVIAGTPLTNFDELGEDLELWAIGNVAGIDLQLLEAA